MTRHMQYKRAINGGRLKSRPLRWGNGVRLDQGDVKGLNFTIQYNTGDSILSPDFTRSRSVDLSKQLFNK